MTIQQKFDNEMRQALEEDKPTSIAIAVSGGPDSMMLSYLAKHFCAQHNIQLHAVIVDHKLRAESSLEAESTRNFLIHQGIHTTILTWEGEKPSTNIQANARNKRYSLIADYCKMHGINYLLTGHHQDDQAETVLLRIMRGSGVDGISGMRKKSYYNKITVLRPMLTINHQMILDNINEIAWPYHNDPSNKNTNFARVRVRNLLSSHDLEPLSQKLVLLANNASRASDYLHQQTYIFLDKACVFCQFGTASIDINLYKHEHEEIALRALSLVLTHIGGNHYHPRLTSLERIHTNLHSNQWRSSTLWGCFLKIKAGRLLIMREESCIPVYTEVTAGHELIWDNRFIVRSNTDGYISTIKKEVFHKLLYPLLEEKKPQASPEIIATLPAFFNHNEELIIIPNIYLNNKYTCTTITTQGFLSAP